MMGNVTRHVPLVQYRLKEQEGLRLSSPTNKDWKNQESRDKNVQCSLLSKTLNETDKGKPVEIYKYSELTDRN